MSFLKQLFLPPTAQELQDCPESRRTDLFEGHYLRLIILAVLFVLSLLIITSFVSSIVGKVQLMKSPESAVRLECLGMCDPQNLHDQVQDSCLAACLSPQKPLDKELGVP